ncbi:hypothetical protein RvY_06490 [Ramazzottius varieornatus]|uniref:HAT C-terminal dimerisation domain-containing protein n=1 Tax=Ramazzottius varieornatus TaxID=947166 RepID=A0A1D1UZ80_RAMVA|nr:hypothetical protein RvY_06490 [Ramazzottius varieornatus]
MLPDPTTVSQYVGKEAKAIRESLLEEVKPILRLRGGGITLDFWGEEYTKYMFGGSELRKRLLCSEWDTVDRKTGAAVQKFIFSKLREIGLCEEELKLCTSVTDQDGNMKVVFRNSGFERINCAGHLLNTCSQNCLKSNPKSQHPMPAEALPVLALVNQVKSLVTHCKQGGISRQLKTTLKQHCETRWNTHVEMFASVVAVYEQLEDLLAERKESHLFPSRQKIQEFRDLFEPVRDATFLLSASKRPTIHLVVPAYLELKRHFKDQVPSDFPEIRAFQKHVENVFNKKLEIDELHRVAVFLDPSMKHLQFLTATERVAVLKRAMEEVQKIPQPEKTGALIVEVASRGSTKFNVKALAKYSADNPIGNEVERYASLPSPPENQDVLSFWTEKENDFPRLKCYALRILSVSATSTPSERLFSRSGTAVSEKLPRAPAPGSGVTAGVVRLTFDVHKDGARHKVRRTPRSSLFMDRLAICYQLAPRRITCLNSWLNVYLGYRIEEAHVLLLELAEHNEEHDLQPRSITKLILKQMNCNIKLIVWGS